MYKQVFTLLRGGAHEAAEQFTDANALAILRQQIRDSAKAIQHSKCAIATAMAQYKREIDNHHAVAEKLSDLEQRALAALENGEDDLARQAAEILATLQDENETSLATQKLFREQISGLKAQLHSAQSTLRDLQRGERLATAAQSTHRMTQHGVCDENASLIAARETLKRLQDRQQQQRLKAEALNELNRTTQARSITEKLATAGCGEPLKTSAEEVMERLRTKTKKPKQT